MNECIAGDRIDALTGDEVERGRKLEQVPAEAGIVEVDYPNLPDPSPDRTVDFSSLEPCIVIRGASRVHFCACVR